MSQLQGQRRGFFNVSPEVVNRRVRLLEVEVKTLSLKLDLVYGFVNKLFGSTFNQYVRDMDNLENVPVGHINLISPGNGASTSAAAGGTGDDADAAGGGGGVTEADSGVHNNVIMANGRRNMKRAFQCNVMEEEEYDYEMNRSEEERVEYEGLGGTSVAGSEGQSASGGSIHSVGTDSIISNAGEGGVSSAETDVVNNPATSTPSTSSKALHEGDIFSPNKSSSYRPKLIPMVFADDGTQEPLEVEAIEGGEGTNKPKVVEKLARIIDGHYFKITGRFEDGRIEAQCQICYPFKTLKGTLTSTSSFVNHLKKIHPEDYETYQAIQMARRNGRNMRRDLGFLRPNLLYSEESAEYRLPLIVDGRYFRATYQNETSITAECQLCNLELKGRTNVTSNFVTHLKTFHPEAWIGYEEYKRSKTRRYNVGARRVQVARVAAPLAAGGRPIGPRAKRARRTGAAEFRASLNLGGPVNAPPPLFGYLLRTRADHQNYEETKEDVEGEEEEELVQLNQCGDLINQGQGEGDEPEMEEEAPPNLVPNFPITYFMENGEKRVVQDDDNNVSNEVTLPL